VTSIDVGVLARRIPQQYPFVLVDRVVEYDPAGRLVALKAVTGAEEFFQGHFPGAPVMPGVLLMEGLAQAAGIWLLTSSGAPDRRRVQVVGFNDAKFRRPVVPGDRLELEVRLLQRRRGVSRFRGDVRAAGQRVAEAELVLHLSEGPASVHPSAEVSPRAELAAGVSVGAFAVIGDGVTLGRGTVIDSHVVIQGPTRIGAENHVFPYASVGLAPQDKKYRGEDSRLEIGDRNTLREFVTLHRGTELGGGLTRIGSDNLLMVYAHVAHDCVIGDRTILANAATLGGHVEIEDWATVSALAGVHQFCRVGSHAYLGGSSVATMDVLPFSMTVGDRARVYGLNRVGLERRGFEPARVKAIRDAFRVLVQSGLPTSEALVRLEGLEDAWGDLGRLVAFVRGSKRGVILKRRGRGETDDDA
jgi:UDP-N-acetylglucosamine acyltransferase